MQTLPTVFTEMHEHTSSTFFFSSVLIRFFGKLIVNTKASIQMALTLYYTLISKCNLLA